MFDPQHPAAELQQLLLESVKRAAQRLADMQSPEGMWTDYCIGDAFTLDKGDPIGASDQWVSAYAGLALAEYGTSFRCPQAVGASERAAAYLTNHRTYKAGWGFNGRTGPDIDSTAHTFLLLARLGRRPSREDIQFLLSGFHAKGGFATFPHGPGAWGQPQCDVTPPALLAIPPEERASFVRPCLEFLRLQRQPGGWWPSYWWRTPFYGTYFVLRLGSAMAAALDESSEPRTELKWDQGGPLDPAETAFAAAIEFHRSEFSSTTIGHLRAFCTFSTVQGAWKGARSLRVPAQSDHSPWAGQRGHCYEDANGIMTTAHVIRALVRLLQGEPFSDDPYRTHSPS